MDLIWLLAENVQLEFFHSDKTPDLDNLQVRTVRWLPTSSFPQIFDIVVCDSDAAHLVDLQVYEEAGRESKGLVEKILFWKRSSKLSFPDMREKILSCTSMWNQAIINTQDVTPTAWCSVEHRCKPQYSILFSKKVSSCPHFDIQVLEEITGDVPSWAGCVLRLKDLQIFSKTSISQWMESAKRIKSLGIKILSLPHDIERRQSLKDCLKDMDLQFSFHWGHDARMTNFRDCPALLKQKLGSYGTKAKLATTINNDLFIVPSGIRGNKSALTRGEFGCALSHLNIYEGVTQPVIIFEDDARIDNQFLFFNIVRNMPAHELWDVCYLQSGSTWWPPRSGGSLNEYFAMCDRSANRTHAYAVTPSGAKILLQYSERFKKIIGAENLLAQVVALPSDDLIAHCHRDNLLKAISPKVRCISPADGQSSIQAADEHLWQLPSQITMKNFGDKWTGIGNQMWQYAVLKVASIKAKAHLAMGPSKLQIRSTEILEGINNIVDVKEQTEFTPIHELLNPKLINTTLQVEGYLQHADYFQGFEEHVRDLFPFSSQVWENSATKLNKLRAQTAKRIVAVHIRLKDFRDDPTEFLYNIWKPEKLEPIINEIRAESFFLIFSNDMVHCQRVFGHLFSKTRHEFFTADQDTDMCCMSMCDDFVISASSFSWWAAFLANRGRVWIPSPWFNERRSDLKNKDVSGLYLKDWTVVQN